AEGLRICWFGGEPTLCPSVIDRLQKQLLELADRHQVDIIPGTIITNGYLLDSDMARHLKDLGIAHAQVTIDGPEAIHDGRRKLRNGKGTFRRIVDNLSDTADIMKINVRINVDRGNVDSAYEVVALLQNEDILPKVDIHFAQVNTSGNTCADIRDRCYGDEEFSHTLVKIYSRLFDEGIYRVEYPRVFTGAAFCGALSEGYFVVSPTGHLFKCWEELSLDPEKSIGDVLATTPGEEQRKKLEEYMAWDPFNMHECRSCGVLPICMGGCPVRGMANQDASKGECLYWKYNLEEMITLHYSCKMREAIDR
ncbi:MAG: SPASM domain-containing protein, partial [Candidatus Zixiibacteriota bacterium]